MRSIAIFGGTFDPVHNGHIQTSAAIQSNFHFDYYYFVPCKIPTIKPNSFANTQQRIDMLQLAIKNFKNFSLDLREVNRDTPSYMVETLKSFRDENEDASISLIIGYDAFLSLHHWHQWENIIELANLLVINRNNYAHLAIPEAVELLLKQHQCVRKSQLLTSRSGTIILFDAGNYEISSTDIREELKLKKNVEDKLPKAVYEYIKQSGLYQPKSSS